MPAGDTPGRRTWWALETGFLDAPLSSLPSPARGLPPPEIPEPEPFHGEAPEEVNLSGFGAVVFAAGFRPDYESWVRFPGAFD
jgi:hypothetical protein